MTEPCSLTSTLVLGQRCHGAPWGVGRMDQALVVPKGHQLAIAQWWPRGGGHHGGLGWGGIVDGGSRASVAENNAVSRGSPVGPALVRCCDEADHASYSCSGRATDGRSEVHCCRQRSNALHCLIAVKGALHCLIAACRLRLSATARPTLFEFNPRFTRERFNQRGFNPKYRC